MNRKLALVAFAALAATTAFLLPARSQAAYPGKPVKVFVGVAAGGASDVMARFAAQMLGESLGQSFVVDNKPGAGGTLAASTAAKSPADGYTLLVSAPTVMVVAPFLYKHLGFVPTRDFAPIAVLGGGPLTMVVHADVNACNVSEFIALAKNRPGQIAFGSGGQGTASHLSSELFASMAGVKLLHAPYKGDGQGVNDLLGGQVQMMITAYNLVEPHIRSGRLKLLATTGKSRFAATPEVPTLDESGLKGYESLGWIALYAPAGTPAAVIGKLNAEWQKIRRQPEVVARLESMGWNAISFNSPEEFVAFQTAEVARWGKVIADAGVKPE